MIPARTHSRIVHHLSEDDKRSEISYSFVINESANLEYFLIISGAQSRKIILEFILQGAHAQATIKGAYRLCDAAEISIETRQIHDAQHTTSSLQINGLLDDHARLNYNGLIHISKSAQRSCAVQENKTLLFSEHARAISVPSLQVLADKVSCAHGSAIGKLDQDLLHFLQLRGMELAAAKELLIEGFFAEYMDEKY
jgi:Fe-S cluster assembly protein SufD